jgi:hypothetical protein
MTGCTIFKALINLSVVLLFGCDDKHAILPIEFSDPYLNSFRGKDIKYVILERQDWHSNPDTIELDRVGNIVRIESGASTVRQSYDSLGFLRRKLERSDISSHYLIRYSLKGDTLLQIWREINSSNWNLGTDTSSRWHHVVIFEYDSKGKIATEINGGSDVIKYVYEDDLLVKKEAFTSIYPMVYSHAWLYEYDNDSVLKRIIVQWPKERGQDVVFFSGGLPDSTSSLKSGQYKYRYVHY